jgi:hypothetical protein
MYRDPGPTSVTVPPSGRASFGITVDVNGSGSCKPETSLRISLPGQQKWNLAPLIVPPCQVTETTITAMVAGGVGPRS